jgi:hypothetical protein
VREEAREKREVREKAREKREVREEKDKRVC